MRILLTLPLPLFPPDTGGKIRSLNLFQRLASRHEIHAVSLADQEREAAAVREMRHLFRSYTPVFWEETPNFSPSFYAAFLASRFRPLPYFLAKYCVPRFRDTVEMLARRERFDLLFCDFLQSAVVMLGTEIRPRIVFQHNLEYRVRKRQCEAESRPLRKWLLQAEWRKARAIEREVCREFDHVIAVSEEDRRMFVDEFRLTRVSALPTGVDLGYFYPQNVEPERGRLVFVGSMDWYPNEDGVVWFCEQVYPRIRHVAPHASLTVVGRNPSARLHAIAAQDPSVKITGRVDDVRPFLSRAEVVLVPLRIGGGTRIKIFEAMAMGRPLVSTSLGAEGLPLVPDYEVKLADEPGAFAQAVVSLLNDPEKRLALARAAREKVMRQHSWERAANTLEEILEGTVDQGAVGEARFLGPPGSWNRAPAGKMSEG